MNIQKLFKDFILITLLILAAFFLKDHSNISAFIADKINHYVYISVCSRPISYKIGSIDPRFNLSENQLLDYIKTSAQIWNKPEGKILFSYDQRKENSITVNLVFDKRQQLSSQINQLQGELDQKKQTLKPKIEQYEQRVVEFKKKVAELNSQIEYWNSKGGAPEDEYQKLKSEQNSLKIEAEELNQMAHDLNLSTKDYNSDVYQLNQTINTFDEALQKKPEEGLFDPSLNKIDLYFNNDKNELIHTLAHELGHALGMPHNSNPSSIMYPFSSKKITPTQDDINDLNQVCDQRILNLPSFFDIRIKFSD